MYYTLIAVQVKGKSGNGCHRLGVTDIIGEVPRLE
jgi:hypothetical protein